MGNGTLDWFYAVLGSEHFDCEGRRGKNVLRIKVKTRGALEYICPLINQCIEEGLLNHVSCPISTKKQRRHIRGYLAYLEAVSESATDRMIEIFNELNQDFVTNCDGILEHPFKGISRNPIPIRTLKNNNGIAAWFSFGTLLQKNSNLLVFYRLCDKSLHRFLLFS